MQIFNNQEICFCENNKEKSSQKENNIKVTADFLKQEKTKRDLEKKLSKNKLKEEEEEFE